MIVALTVEMVLFLFHLHGRDIVDVHMHMLLVYTIAGCIVAVALELKYPHSINAGLARYNVLFINLTATYLSLYSSAKTCAHRNCISNLHTELVYQYVSM